MVQNWKLLAATLSLPILSLIAGENTIESLVPEAALTEITYNSKFGPTDGMTDKKCYGRRRVPVTPIPEEEAINDQSGQITPSVAPTIVDGSDTFVIADFIWWKTHIDGMEFAYSGVTDEDFLSLLEQVQQREWCKILTLDLNLD